MLQHQQKETAFKTRVVKMDVIDRLFAEKQGRQPGNRQKPHAVHIENVCFAQCLPMPQQQDNGVCAEFQRIRQAFFTRAQRKQGDAANQSAGQGALRGAETRRYKNCG